MCLIVAGLSKSQVKNNCYTISNIHSQIFSLLSHFSLRNIMRKLQIMSPVFRFVVIWCHKLAGVTDRYHGNMAFGVSLGGLWVTF